MSMVWLNGRIADAGQAFLSTTDRGFTLADGVFETIRAHGRTCLWLNDHLGRLQGSAACLGIPLSYERSDLEDAIGELLECWGHEASAVRFTLSRGPSERRGIWPPSDPVQPTVLISGAPLTARGPGTLSVAQSTRRNEASPLSRIKSLNYGDNILARREASAAGADEALMLNTRGRVACAAVGNIFLRFGDTWVTPALAEGVLPGLARKRLIVALGAVETEIPESMLNIVTGAFVSNSLDCMVVRELAGRPLPDVAAVIDRCDLYG